MVLKLHLMVFEDCIYFSSTASYTSITAASVESLVETYQKFVGHFKEFTVETLGSWGPRARVVF